MRYALIAGNGRFPLLALESARRLNDRDIVSGSGHKLQAGRKIFFRKAAWNRQRGKAAEIADAAERVRKDQIGF